MVASKEMGPPVPLAPGLRDWSHSLETLQRGLECAKFEFPFYDKGGAKQGRLCEEQLLAAHKQHGPGLVSRSNGESIGDNGYAVCNSGVFHFMRRV